MEPISFNELYFTRMIYEITFDASDQRLPEFMDKLTDILPDIDQYKAILYAIADMPDQAQQADRRDSESKSLRKSSNGFERRAILGEWVKLSLQLNIREETIR